MSNARFWVYVNGGPVKLTLRSGQTISHFEGGQCEEGYSVVHTSWELVAGIVYREYSLDSRDCDGRHFHFSSDSARINDLDVKLHDDGILWPNWNDRTASQSDQHAEMAGY